MKKIRLFSLLLLLAVLLSAAAPAFAASPDDTAAPQAASSQPGADTNAAISSGSLGLDAKLPQRTDAIMKSGDSALLYEMDSGTMLYGTNMDKTVDPAGFVKLMTALVTMEEANRSEQVTVTKENLDNVPGNSLTFGLKAGETLTVEQLLYCLILESGNDAAVVLAEHTLGTQAAFVKAMNEKAAALGCTGTNFTNVHGIHDDKQYTTARDLAKIMNCALEYDLFCEVITAPHYELPPTNQCSEKRDLYSRNYMSGKYIIDAYYDERCTGGKTMYNQDGKRSIIVTAEMDGLHFIGVVMNTVPDVAEDDPTNILEFNEFWEMRRILNLVDGEYEVKRVLFENQVVHQFPVTNGTSDVAAVSNRNVDTLLPVKAEQKDLTYRLVRSSSALTAPVQAGDIVDIVQVWYGNVCVAQTDLVALNASSVAAAPTAEYGGSNAGKLDMGGVVKILAVLGAIVLVIGGAFGVLYLIRMVRLSKLRAKRRRRRSERRRSR